MIAKWVIVAWLTLGAILTVTMVGKPRKPTTPGGTAGVVLITAAIVVIIILQWR